jgi:integrase
MRSKPKGKKYRNLYARGGVIYVQLRHKGRRYRYSAQTADWAQAAAVRDEIERKIRRGGFVAEERAPRFDEFVVRYLEEDTDHLAPTTRGDRKRELREGGPIGSYLGSYRLDAIDEATLREWWTVAVVQAGRATKTGRNLLDCVSGVLRYAVELRLIDSNPVDGFRRVLAHKARTQKGRAAAQREPRPIEDPADIDRLLAAADEERSEEQAWRNGRPYSPQARREIGVYVLLMLDAGLRSGEALGLRWRSVLWGESEDDERRALVIEESRPRGGESGLTKTGRARRVALSFRLRDALFELYRERRPAGEEHVLQSPEKTLYRSFDRVRRRANIGPVHRHGLRHTFASQLLTVGVQPGYLARQIGDNLTTFVRYYAKWCGGDEYIEPLRPEPGEVPADLLARLQKRPHSAPTVADGGFMAKRDAEVRTT